MPRKPENSEREREALADYAHAAWSGWMKYMFGKCEKLEDGSLRIPAWAVDRWTRQMGIEYTDLPAEEKNSDREEADKMLSIMKEK